MIITAILCLVVMLSQNRYCPSEDNNFKLIAIAGLILILSSFAPSGVFASISLGLIISIGLIVLENFEDVEDRYIAQIAIKLFGKKSPAELNTKFGTFGGGFTELLLRTELERPIFRRKKKILDGIRIFILLLVIINIAISIAGVISSFGWISLVVIPVSTAVVYVIMFSAHYMLYER